jgi:ribulose bisphosphate carboxylase small subunit
MATCGRCDGTGVEVYDEDDRRIESVCYHCSGSGDIDDSTAFYDSLGSVASLMSQSHVREYIRAVNEDPDGEGFAFMAAEDMMTPWELEQSLVYSYTGEFMERLEELSNEVQKEYVRKMKDGEVIEPLY